VSRAVAFPRELDIPSPLAHELPADYAARIGGLFSSGKNADRQRELGQFFTTVEVARFMAHLARPSRRPRHILDPGAGTGILACAVCEELTDSSGPVHLDAFEIDPRVARFCNAALEHAKSWLSDRGVDFTFRVHEKDFVSENAVYLTETLFGFKPAYPYDLAILNPPYFKLQKNDPRALAAAEIVHGQPNIYSIFLAITASLLSECGVMVSITPRSFTTGDYFRRFREHLFSKVTPEAIHLFDSRQDAFRKDAVLQENVIIRARKIAPDASLTVRVSTSSGTDDLRQREARSVPVSAVVDLKSRDLIFNIPAHDRDDEALSLVRAWTDNLASLGLTVSTGPVVAFRAKDSLLKQPADDEPAVPLLWLNHILPMEVVWPLEARQKAQYIRHDDSTHKLLVPSENYVVLRRFSAKEDARRVIAAPLFGRDFSKTAIGLENHLNYIYRTHGKITRQEAVGLAAVLGSSLVDRYFRVSNGNTQVNATELRALPLPSLKLIKTIGEELIHSSAPAAEIDCVVLEVLGISPLIAGPAGSRTGE
jgi:adenine-specific DNA-methyltransferase